MQSFHDLVRDVLRANLHSFLECDSVFSPLPTVDSGRVLFSVVSNIVMSSPYIAASLHIHFDHEIVEELLKRKYGTPSFTPHDCVDALNEICNLTAGKIRATLEGHLPGTTTMSLPYVTRAFDELLNGGHPDDQSLRWFIETPAGTIAAHSRFRIRNMSPEDFSGAITVAHQNFANAGSSIEML